MLNFLANNIGTIIIAVIVAAALAAIIAGIIKKKKQGKCAGCDCACGGCDKCK